MGSGAGASNIVRFQLWLPDVHTRQVSPRLQILVPKEEKADVLLGHCGERRWLPAKRPASRRSGREGRRGAVPCRPQGRPRTSRATGVWHSRLTPRLTDGPLPDFLNFRKQTWGPVAHKNHAQVPHPGSPCSQVTTTQEMASTSSEGSSWVSAARTGRPQHPRVSTPRRSPMNNLGLFMEPPACLLRQGSPVTRHSAWGSPPPPSPPAPPPRGGRALGSLPCFP